MICRLFPNCFGMSTWDQFSFGILYSRFHSKYLNLMLHDCSGKLEMDHDADSDSLMGLPPRDMNKPCVCCNAETNCGQNQETVCYRTISPTIANFWWAFENTPRTNLHVDCELINMLLLFFREESILLRADETPADGGFVNRSFVRGMDVTILAQKTVL